MKVDRQSLNANGQEICVEPDAEWVNGGRCPVIYDGSRCLGILEETVTVTTRPDGLLQRTVTMVCSNISTQHTHLVSQ